MRLEQALDLTREGVFLAMQTARETTPGDILLFPRKKLEMTKELRNEY